MYPLRYNEFMKNNVKNLSSLSREELEKQYIDLATKYDSALAKVEWYKTQYELSRQRMFGRSSEKDMAGQMTLDELLLFNEAEALREPINIEATTEETEVLAVRSRRNDRHKKLPPLEAVTDVFELSPEECICETCGSELHEMKETVRVELEVIPADVRVHRYVTKTYVCRACSRNGNTRIINAPGAPAPLLPGSILSPSLMADIIAKKYVDATPFYRQEQNYAREALPITRNNMCNWSIRIANDYFAPVVKRMRQVLFSDDVIHCDETEVQVLKEKDRPAARKSRVWVMANAEYVKDKRIALYNYTETRSLADARNVLDGYSGYIMCDGYTVYDSLSAKSVDGRKPLDTKTVACLVHVRRKFTDALKLIKPEDRPGTSAQLAVAKLAQIFKIDNEIPRDNPGERKNKRLELLYKPMEQFFEWVKSEQAEALPEFGYGKALTYAMNQRENVMRVFEDGRLELDNSLAERTVKPFVIGRKNWLFADTPEGADASCILYSLVETAKQNNLVPYRYLKYVLEQMRGKKLTDELIEDVLPWSGKLPKYVRKPME